MIQDQWVAEVRKLVQSDSALRVLVYNGVHADGFLRPSRLAQYDLVITTYAVLQRDIYHVRAQGSGGRSSRYVKKYPTAVSPLAVVEWWRICTCCVPTSSCGGSTLVSRLANILLVLLFVGRIT